MSIIAQPTPIQSFLTTGQLRRGERAHVLVKEGKNETLKTVKFRVNLQII